MSAPFCSNLQASPRGTSFLWIANQEGHRNLWIAEAKGGSFAVRKLTNYEDDDGQEIGDVSWMPDGERIVYARSGDFEFPGRPAPNPALLPNGVEQDIWITSTQGGEPRKLAQGRKPTVSPDGATLAFLSKDQILHSICVMRGRSRCNSFMDGAASARLRGRPMENIWPSEAIAKTTASRGILARGKNHFATLIPLQKLTVVQSGLQTAAVLPLCACRLTRRASTSSHTARDSPAPSTSPTPLREKVMKSGARSQDREVSSTSSQRSISCSGAPAITSSFPGNGRLAASLFRTCSGRCGGPAYAR